MIWLAIIVAPLAAAVSLAFVRTRALATRVLAPLAAVPALAVALLADGDSSAHFGWLLLGTHFGFGDNGRVVLFFTALLWTAAGVYAASEFARAPGAARFFVFFTLTMCGNIGLAAAQDVASFYFFFALMTFSAYGLVVHERTAEAYRAGRIYLVAAVFGEVLLLAALILAASEMKTLMLAEARAAVAASESRDLIVLLALSGFGVKAGAALVHFWLPLAHPVAPVPASAVLSGAMIKAGLLGWLHFVPFGQSDFPGWGAVLVGLGYLAAFGGAAIGLVQREPKTVLAYSSISQMGFITAVLGTGLAGASLWPLVSAAVGAFALNHALAKGALFLGAGVIHRAPPGLARRVVLGGLAIAALAIAGAPWTGGAIAKHAAKEALSGLDASYAPLLPLLMSLASVATTMLLTHFVAIASREAAGDTPRPVAFASWAVLVMCAALVAPPAIGAFVSGIDPAERDLWNETWPILAGMLAYGASARMLRSPTFGVPPGDIVVLLERAAHAGRAAAARVPLPGPAAWQINFVHYLEALAATEERRDLSRRIELRLTRWSNAGLAFAGVIVALALLVMF